MPRIVRKQLAAAAVRAAGPGRHTDGNGLMLYVKQFGARSWVQRLRLFGERFDLGLGSADRDGAVRSKPSPRPSTPFPSPVWRSGSWC